MGANRVNSPRIHSPRIHSPRIHSPRIHSPRIHSPRIHSPWEMPTGTGRMLGHPRGADRPRAPSASARSREGDGPCDGSAGGGGGGRSPTNETHSGLTARGPLFRFGGGRRARGSGGPRVGGSGVEGGADAVDVRLRQVLLVLVQALDQPLLHHLRTGEGGGGGTRERPCKGGCGMAPGPASRSPARGEGCNRREGTRRRRPPCRDALEGRGGHPPLTPLGRPANAQPCLPDAKCQLCNRQ